jgi:nucleoid DNA-binding protein
MAANKKVEKEIKRAPTKSEIYAHIAEDSGLTRSQVASVLNSLSGLVAKNLKSRGPGTFTLPGLCKIKIVRKPATKARKGINPFTKEETMFKAKPARNVVKIQALKGLKDQV